MEKKRDMRGKNEIKVKHQIIQEFYLPEKRFNYCNRHCQSCALIPSNFQCPPADFQIPVPTSLCQRMLHLRGVLAGLGILNWSNYKVVVKYHSSLNSEIGSSATYFALFPKISIVLNSSNSQFIRCPSLSPFCLCHFPIFLNFTGISQTDNLYLNPCVSISIWGNLNRDIY